jgi:predicted dehydrogenase
VIECEAKKYHVNVMVGFQMRFLQNHVDVARRMIRRGSIGSLLAAEVHSEALRIKPADGILLDYGTHFFDLLRWYLSDQTVTKVGAQVVKSEGNQFALVYLTFASNIVCSLCLYWVPGYTSGKELDRYVRFIGERGKITTDQSSSFLNLYRPRSGIQVKHYDNSKSYPRRYEGEIKEFVKSIMEGRQSSITAFDGLMAIKIAEAAKESSERGKSVSIKS